MKAVQTFWANKSNVSELTGGWVDFRYHLMSWALSSSLLKRHFPSVALHTDRLGKEILIDSLQLPYDEVHLSQEGLGVQHPKPFWVMRKMHTLSLMKEHFLHIDSDAYFFQSLPVDMFDREIIVQNFQIDFHCYPKAMGQLSSARISLPDFMINTHTVSNAVNMGIAGGKDFQVFAAFYEAMNLYLEEFGSQILSGGKGIESGYLNTFLEECCFYNYISRSGKIITPFLRKKFDDSYAGMGNLLNDRFGYFHLIGHHKRNLSYCKLVQQTLKKQFPATFRKVDDFIRLCVCQSRQYNYSEVFAESNARAKEKGHKFRITLENYESIFKQLEEKNELQICETILFEREKHETALEQLNNKEEFNALEADRFCLFDGYLTNTVLDERMSDEICYLNNVPVFSRKLVEGANAGHDIQLSLIFDFDYGFEHCEKRIWDDLSIFILCMASSGNISIRELINEVLKKVNNLNSRQKRKLIGRMDIRIKELFLAGLIRYSIHGKDKFDLNLEETTRNMAAI